jgi:hypothetical protein
MSNPEVFVYSPKRNIYQIWKYHLRKCCKYQKKLSLACYKKHRNMLQINNTVHTCDQTPNSQWVELHGPSQSTTSAGLCKWAQELLWTVLSPMFESWNCCTHWKPIVCFPWPQCVEHSVIGHVLHLDTNTANCSYTGHSFKSNRGTIVKVYNHTDTLHAYLWETTKQEIAM